MLETIITTKARLIIVLIFILFTFSLAAQNKIVVDEKSGKPMLIGVCSIEAFHDSSFDWWYKTEFQNYDSNKEIIKKLNDKLNNYEIEIILGSWCSDSRREVPRFIKILKKDGYNFDRLKIYAVDRNRNSPEGDIKEKNIDLVPTFIFYENKEEKGRIIETPIKTLEEDIFDIITN